MELLLKRIYLGSYTIGKLYIDSYYFCDTLEDRVRDFNKDGDLLDEGEEKIYSETAIPYGTYKVELTYSPKFKRILPLIVGVKHFEGIRIHGVMKGAIAKPVHTAGCVLVGKNSVKGGLTSSFEYLEKLMEKLNNVEDIKIKIV
jgi:hypothetical protein